MAAFAVLCAGCRLGLAVDVEVDREGAGTLAVAVSADRELQELAADADADPLADLVEAGRALREGWRVGDRTDGEGTRTVRLTARFADPEEFAALTDELVGALAADEVRLVHRLALDLDEDSIAVAADVGARPTRAVRDYGLTPRRAVRLVRDAEALRYDVRVALPGEILESNGRTAEDGRQVWSVAPGERLEVRARSTRPGPPWLRGVLGAAAGGLLVVVALWLVARRRRRV